MSDVLVLLLADSYGPRPPGELRSYAELEYEWPMRYGIQVLAFIADHAATPEAQADVPAAELGTPSTARGADAEADAEALGRFEHQVISNQEFSRLTDVPSFRRALTAALTDFASDRASQNA